MGNCVIAVDASLLNGDTGVMRDDVMGVVVMKEEVSVDSVVMGFGVSVRVGRSLKVSD